MDKEIEELKNRLIEAQKSEPMQLVVESEPTTTEVKTENKKKVEFGDFEFVLCIKKTWFAIVLSILMYCGLALMPILIALIAR